MYTVKQGNTLEDAKWKFKSDLHTHSIVSGHAYTTLMENIDFCSSEGIKILGSSEHGPHFPGGPHEAYFHNMRIIPRKIKGVTVLRGCELNIMNAQGDVDPGFERFKKVMDYCIASLHELVVAPMSLEENTQAIINAVNRYPEIIILGHTGNPNYPIDQEKIVKLAKEKDIIIEINNSSLGNGSRKGSRSNCQRIAELCMEHGVKVILSTDAHINSEIGRFDRSIMLLDEIEFPEVLVMNEPEKLMRYLHERGIATDVD